MWSEVFPIYSDNKIIQRKIFSLFFVSGMMDASLVMLLTSSTNSFQNTTQLAAAISFALFDPSALLSMRIESRVATMIMPLKWPSISPPKNLNKFLIFATFSVFTEFWNWKQIYVSLDRFHSQESLAFIHFSNQIPFVLINTKPDHFLPYANIIFTLQNGLPSALKRHHHLRPWDVGWMMKH